MAVTSACPGGSGRRGAAVPPGSTPGGPGSSWSMATEPETGLLGPAIELAPAAERGERWWPVALAIIVVAFLHVILPAGTGSSRRWSRPCCSGCWPR